MTKPVFVIHASSDRDMAASVRHALGSLGIAAAESLAVDGHGAWSAAMDQAMDAAAGCLLLIGATGLAAAGGLEMQLSLARLAGRGAPVAAVLLPGAEIEDTPLFLRNQPLMDLRHEPDPSRLPGILRRDFAAPLSIRSLRT